MAIRNPKFPTTIWDGLSDNHERESRLDDAQPDSRDWDQIVAELIATQEIIVSGNTQLAVLSTPISGGTNGLILKLSNGQLAQLQRATAIPDTVSATLPNLEIEVNKLKQVLRDAKIMS